jgi:hypothetical protein
MALPWFLVLGPLLERVAQQALHDKHVLPLAVEAAVAAVNADLAPPTRLHQGNACLISRRRSCRAIASAWPGVANRMRIWTAMLEL